MSWRVKTGPGAMATTSLMRTWPRRAARARGVVADLVGVGKTTCVGLSLWMSCCRARVKPSGVYWASSGCSTRMTLRYSLGGDFGGEGFSICADDGCGDGEARIARRVFAGCEGFPTDAGDAALPLFHGLKLKHNQNAAHRTRTSNFSFSTRAAAASLGEPESIWVDFCLWGSATGREHDRGGIDGEFRGGDAADFLGFGALDAHQRGVAELVAAGLDGEDGGSGQLDGSGTSLLPARA
jgi:hypothetical protein